MKISLKLLLIALFISCVIGNTNVFSMLPDNQLEGKDDAILEQARSCRIPYDIWNVVASFLYQKDAANLALVSRASADVVRRGLSHIDFFRKPDAYINIILFNRNGTAFFRDLTSFNFRSSDITNATVQRIVTVYSPPTYNDTGITKLDIRDCRQLTNLTINSISLTGLILATTNGYDLPIVAIIANCPNLTFLHLSGCRQLTNNLIINSVSLTELSLYYTKVDDATIATIITNSPNLTFLTLYGYRQLTNDLIINSTSLIELNLSLTDVNDATIAAIIAGCPNLRTLELWLCKQLTNDLQIVSTSLTELNLGYTDVGDVTVAAIIQNCPNLRELDLSFCKNLTNNLTINSTFLTELDLSRTNVDNATIAAIIASCPSLRELVLCRCNHVSRGCKDALRAHGIKVRG